MTLAHMIVNRHEDPQHAMKRLKRQRHIVRDVTNYPSIEELVRDRGR